VFVSGRLKQRSYQDREGVTRTVIELEVDEVGPSLRYATARVEKAGRREATSAGASAGAGAIGASGELTRAARDGGVADETPF
jgi:single-strand DNA-binding protein